MINIEFVFCFFSLFLCGYVQCTNHSTTNKNLVDASSMKMPILFQTKTGSEITAETNTEHVDIRNITSATDLALYLEHVTGGHMCFIDVDVYSSVVPEIFPVDNTATSFIGKLPDAIFVWFKCCLKCSLEIIRALNITDLLEEHSVNVTLPRTLFCEMPGNYTVHFDETQTIPYFTGYNVYFIDEVDRCTKQLNYFIGEGTNQSTHSLLNNFLNTTKCWDVMYHTHQQTISFAISNITETNTYFVTGNMQSGIMLYHSSKVIFTSTQNNCIQTFLQYINSTGYKKNYAQVLISVHNIKIFTKEYSCLEVHYQCIGDAFQQPFLYIPDRAVVYLEEAITGLIIISNIFVLFAFLRKENQSPVTILLSALAVSDTLTAIFYTINFAISYHFYDHQIDYRGIMPAVYIFHYPFCVFYGAVNPLANMFHKISVYITVYLCIQKTVALKYPFWAMRNLNKRASVIFSVVTFTISVVIYTPIIKIGLSTLTDVDGKCCLVRDVYMNTAKVLGQLYIVVGFLNTSEVLVVFVCTIYITRKLTCLRDNLPWTDNPVVRKRNRASATTVVIICVIFILFEILNIVQIVQYYQAGISLIEPYHTQHIKMKQFQYLSVMIGSSMNFIVYLVMSENLRETMCTPFRNFVRRIKCS